jgi:5-methylcytosine-specific restriction protein A
MSVKKISVFKISKPACSKLIYKSKDADVKKTAARGYGSKWRTESKKWLQANPLCAHCIKENKLKKADCVDHIEPHRLDMHLFWSRRNWQSLCFRCHSLKTIKDKANYK